MLEMPLDIAAQVERKVPEFVDMVQRADGEVIKISLDSFSGEPKFLYYCLWYAASQHKRFQAEFHLKIEPSGSWGRSLLQGPWDWDDKFP